MTTNGAVARRMIAGGFLLLSVTVAMSAELPIRRIAILDRSVSPETLSTAFQERVAQGVDLELIRDVHQYLGSLDVLSEKDRNDQLGAWVQLRACIDPTNRTQLLFSEMISALVADTVAHCTMEARRFERGTQQVAGTLRDLDRIMRENQQVSDVQRPLMLSSFAIQQVPSNVFHSVLQTAEKKAADAYQEKWGKNVVAMQRAAKGHTSCPSGLKALAQETPRQWKDLFDEQHREKALNWVVAVDLHNYQVLTGIEKLLRTRDPSVPAHPHPIWSSAESPKDEGDLLGDIIMGTPPENVLLLH